LEDDTKTQLSLYYRLTSQALSVLPNETCTETELTYAC